MHASIKSFSLVIICSILPVIEASAQIALSPYSIFGLGSIEENSMGANKAMGGTGIAFSSKHSINFLNPASYDGIDSLVTIYELGCYAQYSSSKSSNKSQVLFDANIKYLAMGFRIAPRIATSFGITSYSKIGYNINVSSPIEGSPSLYNKTFSGEGGVNQLYLGNSVKITNNFVLGINAVYLFGTVSHSETSDAFGYSFKNLTYLSNININYGLNYQIVNNRWKYTIGLIYNNGKTLTTKNETALKIDNETETIKSRSSTFKIPKDYGIGLSVSKDYFRLGIDYEMKKWKDVDFANPLLKTRNSNRLSLGVEFPSPGINRGTNRMMYYRFGAEYNGSYLIIDNIPINYRSVSFGTGIPVKGVLSVINLSLELGQNGTKKGGLFKENFCTLHIDVSLKDYWFVKRKYD
jgi:hypothetical protein